MDTRIRHILAPETVERLNSERNGATWREYANRLGYEESYAATLNKAARNTPGAMSRKAETILRQKLGLPAALQKRRRYHRPCMDDETYERWLAYKGSVTP